MDSVGHETPRFPSPCSTNILTPLLSFPSTAFGVPGRPYCELDVASRTCRQQWCARNPHPSRTTRPTKNCGNLPSPPPLARLLPRFLHVSKWNPDHCFSIHCHPVSLVNYAVNLILRLTSRQPSRPASCWSIPPANPCRFRAQLQSSFTATSKRKQISLHRSQL